MIMKLYQVMFDGSWEFVEAGSFGHAVDLWRANLKREDPDSWTDEELADTEPEQVVLASERSVIRAPHTEGTK